MVSEPTLDQVEGAYSALASGDKDRIAEYYHESLQWLVPGNHPLAGRYCSRDEFLHMMEYAGELTGGTFAMERKVTMLGDGFSSDMCRNTALRTGAAADSCSPYDRLDVEVFHLLRWQDGRIIEGRDGLFGDSATAFSQFWSQLRSNGSRAAS
jgi:uncharacterized protein